MVLKAKHLSKKQHTSSDTISQRILRMMAFICSPGKTSHKACSTGLAMGFVMAVCCAVCCSVSCCVEDCGAKSANASYKMHGHHNRTHSEDDLNLVFSFIPHRPILSTQGRGPGVDGWLTDSSQTRIWGKLVSSCSMLAGHCRV